MEQKRISGNGTVGDAFRFLFEALDLADMYWASRDNEHATLSSHPFGLKSHPSVQVFHDAFFLVAFPGHSDESIRNMALVLQHAIRSGNVFGLRIIKIPAGINRQGPHQMHDLYFEVNTAVGTFLCGGCNDHSGAGGTAGKQLKTIFCAVGQLYGYAMDEVTLQLDNQKVMNALSDHYDEVMRSRRRYA